MSRLLKAMILFLISLPMYAVRETNDSVNYERIMKEMLQEDYIKASLLIASSGYAIYSAPGHAALRLECPSHQIDYCYEFDNIVNMTHIIDYINGDMQALFVRIYSEDFIQRYSKEGRGVQSVTLNLLPQQKINLWQSLDFQVDSIGKRSFDFLNNNCASMVVRALKECVYPERIHYKDVSPHLKGTHRHVFPYIFSNAPWAEFFWNIIMGTGFDEEYDLDSRLFPVALIDIWPKSELVDLNGNSRPLCSGSVETIIFPQIEDKPSRMTPKVLFCILFLLTLFTSVIDFFKTSKVVSIICIIIDSILMMVETLLGIIISYMLLFSNQVATSWNWLIVVFSPIPIILWILFHKHPKFSKLYPLYVVTLFSFLILTPLIPQLQYGYVYLLLLSLFVRCLVLWIKYLVNINNNFKN